MTFSDQERAERPTRRLTRIRTFHPRRGRMRPRHLDALDRLWPAYGLIIAQAEPVRAGLHEVTELDGWVTPAGTIRTPLDIEAVYGRQAPLVLDIGFGMGEATAEMAAADPARDYLAVDVHTPGIANLLAAVDQRGLTNVRVARGDAVDLLRYMLPADCLDAVHVFFPDPWPKARHHKRRLIQPDHVALLRSRLVPGGTLHCATDWAEYAESMRGTLSADPGLVNVHDGFAPRPPHRPVTRFERRGIAAGRTIFDLVFRRSA